MAITVLLDRVTMHENLKKLLFLNKSWPIRIWMWTAVASVIFYLLKFNIVPDLNPSELDMIFMTYGVGSIAVYVLIFGFDWS